MESLIFAFIAAKHLVAREEPVPAERQSLPPLDLQSLRYVHGATREIPSTIAGSKRFASSASHLLIQTLMTQLHSTPQLWNTK